MYSHPGVEFHIQLIICDEWILMKFQYLVKGLFTRIVIFSVGCDSRIWYHKKIRFDPVFCPVSDAAVASNTENHTHVNTL
jgi:hypothetical protein